jgi:oxygen-independent coproporphyrinogen-3 oxidase
MKLYFVENLTLWQPQRYRYAAEQMMLTLFPGERPEYPSEPPDLPRENGVIFDLSAQDSAARVQVRLGHGGKIAEGDCSFPAASLQDVPEKVYHVVQHALKLAFYRAGTELLGQEPPWGALTGVRPVKLPTRAMKAGASPEQAQQELEQEYRVSPVRAALAVDCAKASLAVDRSLKPDEVSLYLGIPFCPTRCAYCSFVSADVGRTLKLVEPYLEAVCQELEVTGQVLKKAGLTVRSFYMGGGTPTTLSAPQLDRLLDQCEQTLPLARCTEFTVEAGRPDTISREKLAVLASHGIGRISINPQTLEDDVLAAIGRKHAAGDIRPAFELAREVGFSCINMDLIAGLPRDSYEGFCRSLEGVLELEPENVTVHTLALKKGSTLMEQGGVLPGGDQVARMLDHSLKTLRGRGYSPYYLYRQKYMSGALENVGWAVPGQESVYNIVMMEELHTVVSVGAGGVTKLVNPKAGTIVRLPNPKYPHDYLSAMDKVLSQKDEILRFYQSGMEGV